MDFDYQLIKDAENTERERRVSSPSSPMLHPAAAQVQPMSRQPPVKPRSSIKSRPLSQQEPRPPALRPSQDAPECLPPVMANGPAAMPLEVLSPALRAHTLLWFHRSQLPRLQKEGQHLPPWLHGFATRREAEKLLQDEPHGCFLLRLSESKVGFVLSYRGKGRCRHFIIEEENSGVPGKGSIYLIAGESSRHSSLQGLIDFYSHNPVGPFDEMLTVPCTKANRVKDDFIKRQLGDAEAGHKAYAPVTVTESPKVDVSLTPDSGNNVVKDAPEYAVVRKPLKKSLSLPDSQNVTENAPSAMQMLGAPSLDPMRRSVLHDNSRNACYVPGTNPATNEDYARVNKARRPTAQNPSAAPNGPACSLQEAELPPRPVPSPTTASEDYKYCHLEPEHTYEETPATATREQIDFYAVGRWGEVKENKGGSGSHIYSEVNIRGARGSSTQNADCPIRSNNNGGHLSPLRPAADLPVRASMQHTYELPRADDSSQMFGGLSTSPPRSRVSVPPSAGRRVPSDLSAIYEQIRDRPTGERPPLPPPNTKY